MTHTGASSLELGDVLGIQQAVDAVVGSAWWASRCGTGKVQVEAQVFGEDCTDGRAYVTKADSDTWKLFVRSDPDPLDSRLGSVTLLHELAHCAAPCAPPHDLPFIHAWLDVLGELESRDMALVIAGELSDDGVPLADCRIGGRGAESATGPPP